MIRTRTAVSVPLIGAPKTLLEHCEFNLFLIILSYFRFSLSLHLFVSGIKSADANELKLIASPPQSEFTSQIGSFKALSSLLPLVSPRVCTTSGGSYSNDGRSKTDTHSQT